MAWQAAKIAEMELIHLMRQLELREIKVKSDEILLMTKIQNKNNVRN
jgi:hypothetical protein